jgi:hypothetical protein
MAWPADDSALGLPDPVKAKGTEAERSLAFADTMRMLTQRIGIFVSLPLEKLSRLALQKELDAIGRTKPHPPKSRRRPGATSEAFTAARC